MLDHCIAYFEAITEKVQGCQPNNDKSHTEAYQKHILTVVMVTKLFVVMMLSKNWSIYETINSNWFGILITRKVLCTNSWN